MTYWNTTPFRMLSSPARPSWPRPPPSVRRRSCRPPPSRSAGAARGRPQHLFDRWPVRWIPNVRRHPGQLERLDPPKLLRRGLVPPHLQLCYDLPAPLGMNENVVGESFAVRLYRGRVIDRPIPPLN